jgi:hypothetical protein
MNLSDLFEETTSGGAPPSRVTAEDVYQRGLRRRRVTRAGLVTAPVAVLAAALVAVVTVVPSGGDKAVPTPAPSASASVDPNSPVRPGYNFPLGTLGASGQHVYVTMPPCWNCGYQLLGSDDGGRTWSVRRTQIAALPHVLVAPGGGVVGFGFTDSIIDPPQISLDGGRTHTLARLVDPIEGARSPDRVTYCGQLPGQQRPPSNEPSANTCDLITVDLRAGTFGLLKTQPDIAVNRLYTGADATLWAAGSVARGGGRVMAVSRSDDGGRTWTRHEFAETAGTTGSVYPIVRTGADGTVVADFVYRDARGFTRFIARLTDGSWQRLTGQPGDSALADPYGGRQVETTYVDGDGTHVVIIREVTAAPPAPGSAAPEDLPVKTTAWAARKGETTYRRVDPPGNLPPYGGTVVDHVTFVPGLGYLAVGTDALWISTDAKTWKKLKLL